MKKRNDADLEVPLSPLIDVVFLLIIFFVVTANLQQEALDWQVQLAKSQFLEPPKENDPTAITINLRYINEQTPPYLSMGGQPVSHKVVEYHLRQARDQFGDKVPVIIRGDHRLQWREIEKINEVVGNAGLSRVQHSAEVLGK